MVKPTGWSGHHGNRYFRKVRADITTAPIQKRTICMFVSAGGSFICERAELNPDRL